MVRASIAFALTAACSGNAVAQPRLSAGQPIPSDTLEAFVDGVVHTTMADAHIAGAAVAVVQNGAVVLSKGYGFADVAAGRHVDPKTTLFRIGSITKTFTWLALLRAVDGGRIALDDPVNQHLPPSLHVPNDGFTEPIRIRHLMTHTSGFEDRMFGHIFVDDPSDVRPLSTYLRDERPRRVREPGVVPSYSNYGAALAGAVLEHVHGRRWQEIIESDILQPLAMHATSTREPYPARGDLPAPMPVDVAASLSRGYRWNGVAHAARRFEHITQIAPAGAISSSAADMARYMLMLLGGGRLGNVAVVPPTVASLDSPSTSLPRQIGNWKAGFLEWVQPGGFRTIGHDGGSLLFFSEMALVPDLALGVFVTTNTAGGDLLSESLPGRIVEQFYAAPAHEPPTRSAADPLLQGFYLQTRRAYSGLEGFLFGLMARQVRVDAEGYLHTNLIGPPQRYAATGGADQFVATSAEGLSAFRFVRRDGVPVQIDTPFMAFERVGVLRQPPVLASLVGLTLLAAVGTLARSRARFHRDVTRTRREWQASVLQTMAAGAWLMAGAGFVWFGTEMLADESTLFSGWPHPGLLAFSTLALLASVLAVGMAALLPAVWRTSGGGWSIARRASYTFVTMTFVACGALLAWWGALQPWQV
jgi:CubicO group peptidase (beta-lactamase class C family)